MNKMLMTILTGIMLALNGPAFSGCTPMPTPMLQYLPSDWYVPRGVSYYTGAWGTWPTANVIRCMPARMDSLATINNVGTYVKTAAASSHISYAIYTNDVTVLRPGSLVATASLSTAATGKISGALSTSVQGGPGGTNFDQVFWFCSNRDSTATVVAEADPILGNAAQIIGSLTTHPTNVTPANNSSYGLNALQCATGACNGGSSTYGTWPSSLVGSGWSEIVGGVGRMPMMVFQVLSVP